MNYVTKVHQERALLDKKNTLEGEIQFLHQTFAFLMLHSTTPSTDPSILALANVIKDDLVRVLTGEVIT